MRWKMHEDVNFSQYLDIYGLFNKCIHVCKMRCAAYYILNLSLENNNTVVTATALRFNVAQLTSFKFELIWSFLYAWVVNNQNILFCRRQTIWRLRVQNFFQQIIDCHYIIIYKRYAENKQACTLAIAFETLCAITNLTPCITPCNWIERN